MKFNIDTEILKNITSILGKIAVKDITNEKGDAITIETSDKKVLFKTNQSDFNILYSIPVPVKKEGSAVVSINILSNLVSSLIDSQTNFELVSKKLIVTTNSSTSNIHTLEDQASSKDFSPPKNGKTFSINREILIKGLKRVQHAASQSVIKPEIGSVYIYTKDNTIYFVATDTFRIAESRFMVDGKINDIDVLIPLNIIQKILKVLEGVSHADVQFTTEGRVVHMKTGEVEIKTGIVVGKFPDYTGLILNKFDSEIIVLRSDINNFLKNARIFSNSLDKLSIKICDKNMIELEFSNENTGSTKSLVKSEIKGDISSTISFNYKNISDALSAIQDEKVILSINKEIQKPVMVRGADDPTLTILISPLITD